MEQSTDEILLVLFVEGSHHSIYFDSLEFDGATLEDAILHLGLWCHGQAAVIALGDSEEEFVKFDAHGHKIRIIRLSSSDEILGLQNQ